MMCPPLREYEPETIKRSGDELAGLSKADQNAATPSLVADYKLLRDQCRAIEDVKP